MTNSTRTAAFTKQLEENHIPDKTRLVGIAISCVSSGGSNLTVDDIFRRAAGLLDGSANFLKGVIRPSQNSAREGVRARQIHSLLIDKIAEVLDGNSISAVLRDASDSDMSFSMKLSVLKHNPNVIAEHINMVIKQNSEYELILLAILHPQATDEQIKAGLGILTTVNGDASIEALERSLAIRSNDRYGDPERVLRILRNVF